MIPKSISPYIKLLRLPDHYAHIGPPLAAAIIIKTPLGWLLPWILGAICIAIVIAIINELVDRHDTDRYSDNPIHIKNAKISIPQTLAMCVIFTILGFYFFYLSRLLPFALIIFIIGIIYSIPPFRLKGRPGLDILCQIGAGFILPFVAPFSLANHIPSFIYPFILSLSLIITAGLFPYQLADFAADQKAGLSCTHIVLGMKKSLIMGFLLTLIGIFIYIYFDIFTSAPWSVPIIFISFYILYKYYSWIPVRSQDAIHISLRNYVKTIRPVSFLFIPYLLIILFWF